MTKMFQLLISALIFSSCTGSPSAHMGITKGHLTPCPDKPNCVISHKADDEHFIEPLEYKDTKSAAHERLKLVIQSMPRTKITLEKPDYLRAEFTSTVMRFVDDVEFYFPDKQIIHIRSASRLGYSDFGVNRKRIEHIRKKFKAQ